MGDFTISGADDFYRLSKALKAAGRTEMRKDLHKSLRKGVTPVLPVARKRLASAMPTGELAKRANRTKQTVQVKTGANPGVTVAVRYGKAGTGLGASNARLANTQGRIRHPVFADKDKKRKKWRWVNQKVPDAKGWFDETYRDAAPKIRPELEKAIQDTVDRIVREAK